MIETLTTLAIFAAGLLIGYATAAVTETRLERKLDKKFWRMTDDLREVFKK